MVREKMDLIWGIQQMERELSEHHSAAANIMNICTEVESQVRELEAARQSAHKEIEKLKADKLKEYSKGYSDGFEAGEIKIQADTAEKVRKLKAVFASDETKIKRWKAYELIDEIFPDSQAGKLRDDKEKK